METKPRLLNNFVSEYALLNSPMVPGHPEEDRRMEVSPNIKCRQKGIKHEKDEDLANSDLHGFLLRRGDEEGLGSTNCQADKPDM